MVVVVLMFLVSQVVSLEPGVPAAGLDLKQQDNNLVVVKLPSTLTNPSRSHALQKAGNVGVEIFRLSTRVHILCSTFPVIIEVVVGEDCCLT